MSRKRSRHKLDACVTHALDLKASWTGAADLRRLRARAPGARASRRERSPNSDDADNTVDEHVLRRPGQLFDPRVASLAEVLDAEDRSGGGQFFPRAPFDRGGRIDVLVSSSGSTAGSARRASWRRRAPSTRRLATTFPAPVTPRSGPRRRRGAARRRAPGVPRHARARIDREPRGAPGCRRSRARRV